MSTINKVIPRDGYLLEVLLDNGSSITLNLSVKLQTLRFGMLADKEFFNTVTTDGTCIRWDNKIEISASELFRLVQK